MVAERRWMHSRRRLQARGPAGDAEAEAEAHRGHGRARAVRMVHGGHGALLLGAEGRVPLVAAAASLP